MVIVTNALLHSKNLDLQFCAGSNPAWGVSEVCDDENHWPWVEVTQPAFTCSKLTIETLEQGVKYVQS